MTAPSQKSDPLSELMRSVKTGRIAHAFLFSGPHGTGKKTAAEQLAQALACQGDNPPCGQCPACRQFLMGNYPDLHIVPGEEKSIPVEEIRSLRSVLSMRPFEGRRHIVLIRNADRMTAQAQNALLKTLEEPSGESVIFLLTDQPSSILPTIRSRCRPVRFHPLNVDQCASVLTRRGIPRERAELLAGCAQGCVGRALEIEADEAYLPLRDRVLSSLAELCGGKGHVAKAVSLLGNLTGRAPALLEILEVIARDRMILDNGGTPYAPQKLLKMNGRALLLGVMDMRRRIAGNVSVTLCLEKMYLTLAGSLSDN